MKGLYLYGVCSAPRQRRLPVHQAGICPERKKIKKSTAKDINKGIGGGKVFRIPCQDIEAIVSETSLEEFGSEEIQRRARESLEWIKDKALTHEKVIETAMNNSDGSIIPMKFGTIFKDRERLTDSLKKDYLKFKDLLKNLNGKEEWSEKVYLKAKLLENEIQKSSPAIHKKLKEFKSLPAGRQYFLEEEVNEMIKREATKSVNSYISIFLEKLKGLAEEVKENKILGKELTGKSDPMVFNGAFLVKKEKVDKLQKEIQNLKIEYEKMGFTFESSGPWPPYNFV